ncbi:MAG: hypothetical protein ACI82Z_002031, partial [Cellvibrionaceae bacterium]
FGNSPRASISSIVGQGLSNLKKQDNRPLVYFFTVFRASISRVAVVYAI